jgi:hypothetical protein
VPLAPWCAGELWTYTTEVRNGIQKVIARVTGRERCPKALLDDAQWLVRNDYEQTLDEAPWFEPDKLLDVRQRDWNLRNPFQNARMFKVGWADRNYEVEVTQGRYDLPLLIQRDDLMPPEYGWQKATLTMLDGSEREHWTSFSGPNLTYYTGIQPNGFCGGVKFVPRTWEFWRWFKT